MSNARHFVHINVCVSNSKCLFFFLPCFFPTYLKILIAAIQANIKMILETLMMVMQNVMFVHWVNLPMDVTKVRVKFVQRGITPMTKKVMERYVKIVAKNVAVVLTVI